MIKDYAVPAACLVDQTVVSVHPQTGIPTILRVARDRVEIKKTQRTELPGSS